MMKSLAIVFVMLSALVTEMAASIHFWHKQYKLSGTANFHHEDCDCLNGGTCISYHLFSQIKYCMCPKGYNGDHCEIDAEAKCFTGNGGDYRGTESVTENGERCLSWDSPILKRWPYNEHMDNALAFGLGKHNYCRNPDGQSKPWCYIRKGYRTVSTSCDIPSCPKRQTCGQRNFRQTFKIVGGNKAHIESQPWIATIFHSNRIGQDQFFCGGSLIDPCWVLTAAHCFPDNSPDTSKLTVILGKSAVNVTDANEQRFNVDRLIIHEGYSQQKTDFDNDIALIRIRSSSGQCAEESNRVKTICLPTENLRLRDHFQCEVSGYGKQSKTDIFYSRILKSTNVHLIPQSLCRKYYENHKVNDNMLCASDLQWKSDSCKGDSGGPLICEYNNRMVLYGIISWGAGCAQKEKPGVYTRVTKYLPWIESNMNGVHFKSFYPPK